MLLKSGSGGSGGRDVLFRLVAMADPAAKKQFADFGKMMVDAQKQITTAAVQEEKKRASEAVKEARKKATEEQKLLKQTAAQKARDAAQEQRASMARDKIIAQNYLKEHLRAIDERIRVEKRQEEELARWKERVRANSAQLEQRENVRLAREAARERAAIEKNQARESARTERDAIRSARREHVLDQRRDRAWEGVIGGVGNIARGAAYSGLVGNKNSETILNTVLGVEGAASLYKGGKGLVEGVGTLATGGVAKGGAALSAGAPFAAAAAAIVSMTAAAASFAGFVRQAAKNGIGGGADYGSYTDTVATKEVQVGSWLYKNTPKALRGAAGGFMNYAFGGVVGSEDAAERTRKEGEHMAAIRAARVSQLKQLGQFQASTNSTLPEAQSRLSQSYSTFASLSSGGGAGEEVKAAYDNVRQNMEAVKRLSIDAARAQIDGSRDYVENLKNAAQLAKQAADESKRNYENDAMKLGSASHEEIALYREIDRKKKSGENLNQREIEAATGLSGYEDFARSQAVKRAEAAGLGDLLAPSRDKAMQDAQKAAETQIKSWAGEVDVEMKHEFVIKLEGGEFADKATEDINAALKEFEKMIEAKLNQGFVDNANRRRPL